MTLAHVSIHDVAPHTLDSVCTVLNFLEDQGVEKVMLLVIPNLPWTEKGLDQLRKWADCGHVFAGHGSTHHVDRAESFYHKLHAALISRDVAEHLSKSEDELSELMQENYRWFESNGLPSPTHYVPPAWALGAISRSRLKELPFDTVEVLSGVIDVRNGRLHRMPLLGYEADTALRVFFLKGFNACNRLWACRSDRCARISIHPVDLQLGLADQIAGDCARFRLTPEASAGIR